MEMDKRISLDSRDSKLSYGKDQMEAHEYDALLGITKGKLKYPKSVFFIFVTEFCERFSYYGMRAVLTIYLRNALHYTDNSAIVIFHVFTVLCYLAPLFGGYIADSILGKFRTIFYLSIVYAIGNVTLSLAATPGIHIPQVGFSLAGLLLIALGTGGIKPCVSAFGAEQFQIPGQEKSLEQYFFVFYFLVNAGSMLSTFLTPIFRKDVQCFEQDTCYSLAFGVPAILMLTALVIFVCGKPLYKIRMPENNVGVEIVKCMTHAIGNRNTSRPRKDHWLDNANDRFDQDFIEDVKSLLKVIVLFIPLPIFWSLFDQQGSQWTLQATRTNGHVLNGWAIKPDQMQLVNSLLVLLLIPTFKMVVYPVLSKCSILQTPLQRMTLGGLLASLSFIIAALVELRIESTTQMAPRYGEANVNFVNTLPCPLRLSLDDLGGKSNVSSTTIFPFENWVARSIPAINYSLSIEPYNQSENCLLNGQPLSFGRSFPLTLPSEQSLSILITGNERLELALSYDVKKGDDVVKSQEGNAKIKILFTGLSPGRNTSVRLKSLGYNYEFPLGETGSGATITKEVEPGGYSVQLLQSSPNGTVQLDEPLLEIQPGTGGSYVLAMFPKSRSQDFPTDEVSTIPPSDEPKMVMGIYVITTPNSVSMLLLLPQYIVITLAEILFAVTGYQFAFSQAPNSMKTVMQSVWLLTNAVGNIIVILVVESGLFSLQSIQFFFFSGLMFIAFVVFTILAYYYKTKTLEPSSPLFKRKNGLSPKMNYMDEDDTRLGEW